MREAGLKSRLRAVQMGSRTCPKCGENYAHCLRACQPAKNKGKGLALNNQPAWPGAAVLVSVACHQKKARASIIVAKSCMPPQLHRWVITSTRSSGGDRPFSRIGGLPTTVSTTHCANARGKPSWRREIPLFRPFLYRPYFRENRASQSLRPGRRGTGLIPLSQYRVSCEATPVKGANAL